MENVYLVISGRKEMRTAQKGGRRCLIWEKLMLSARERDIIIIIAIILCRSQLAAFQLSSRPYKAITRAGRPTASDDGAAQRATPKSQRVTFQRRARVIMRDISEKRAKLIALVVSDDPYIGRQRRRIDWLFITRA